MEPPAVTSLVLVVVLGLTATLPGHTLADAKDTTTINELHTQLNGLNTRQDQVINQLNDMKEYLHKRLGAMEDKVEWALTGNDPHGEKGNQASFLQARVPKVFSGCQDALSHGMRTSGIYTISPGCYTSFDVYCEQGLDGGGWTVFQVRKDGTVDFYRDWCSYTVGFGDLKGEFWLGNHYLHLLTKYHDQELKIEIVGPEGQVYHLDYSEFWVAPETDLFRLHVTGFSGGSPPGNSMDDKHNGQQFSTKDRDNDLYPSLNCAVSYVGGWWYGAGHHANLNGLYGSKEYAKGLNWNSWKGFHVSMKATRMMFRKRP